MLIISTFFFASQVNVVDAKTKQSYSKSQKKSVKKYKRKKTVRRKSSRKKSVKRYKKRKYTKRYKKRRTNRRRSKRLRTIGRSSSLAILKRVKPRGLPLNLVKAVITIESGWRVNARGTSGEKGLMQLMPATSRAWGGRNSFNPTLNLRAGTRYLYHCYKRAKRNIAYTVSCYNAGMGNMYRGHKIKITRRYIARVKRMLRRKS